MGATKFYFLSPEAGQQVRKEKKTVPTRFFLTHISLAAVKPLSRSALLVESHAGGGQRTWPDGGAEP